MKLLERTSKIVQTPFFYICFLLLIIVIAYGTTSPFQGFYWDDWEELYFSNFSDFQAYKDYFSYDRPFSAVFYYTFINILRRNPFHWQIFSLVLRWVGIFFLFRTLVSIWPELKFGLYTSALLLAIYPGFQQQPLAATYSKHFFALALFSISLFLMLLSIKNQKYAFPLRLLSLTFALIHPFILEYFLALELIRPFLIYFFLKRQQSNLSKKQFVVKTIKIWLQYIVILVIFIILRFYFLLNYSTVPISNEPVALNNFLESPLQTIHSFLEVMLNDFYFMSSTIWLNSIFSPINLFEISKTNLVSSFLGLITSLIFYFWADLNNNSSQKRYKQIIGIGFLVFLFGGIPIWIIGRQVSVGKWSDRFALAPMIGIVLLEVFFLIAHIKRKKIINLILAILIGLCISFQFKVSLDYSNQWKYHRTFFWHIYWRTPRLKKNTPLISQSMPIGYTSRYSIAIAMSMIYRDDFDDQKLDYYFINFPKDYSSLDRSSTFQENLRSIEFSSDSTNSVGFVYLPSVGCLRVADAIYKDAAVRPFGSFPIV